MPSFGATAEKRIIASFDSSFIMRWSAFKSRAPFEGKSPRAGAAAGHVAALPLPAPGDAPAQGRPQQRGEQRHEWRRVPRRARRQLRAGADGARLPVAGRLPRTRALPTVAWRCVHGWDAGIRRAEGEASMRICAAPEGAADNDAPVQRSIHNRREIQEVHGPVCVTRARVCARLSRVVLAVA